jgi:hypothetical protein
VISPAEIRARARKAWESQKALRAALAGDAFFPWDIPAGAPAGKAVLTDFAAVGAWIQDLQASSYETLGHGYRIVWRNTDHRQLGSQRLPERVVFESADECFRLIGKAKDWQRLQATASAIVAAEPALNAWVCQQPLQVLAHADVWPRLLDVVRHFQARPRPGCYLRQLDIPGVDTKFIEAHRDVLKQWLDLLLPPDAIDPSVTTLAGNGFERRYGLRHDVPLVRFRILDRRQAHPWGLTDLAVPADDFATLDLPVRHVLITENKVNGLSLPPIDDAMVIFGLGYGLSLLKEAAWLGQRNVHYWGDLDTHGFAMLSQARSYLPDVRSFLMDEATLLAFRPLWTEEAPQKRTTAMLGHLTAAEQAVYDGLVQQRWGDHLRLEQERISLAWVQAAMERLAC